MASVWNTLGEWVFRMVEQKKTESDEFKAALAWYGRERLLDEYRKEKQKRALERDADDSGLEKV